MRSLPPARNQLRIRYRCRLVATGSPSCRRHVQVENLHPQFTFPLPTLLCGDKIPSCLLSNQQVENLLPQFKFPTPPLFVATGGHRVEGMCKLKTCTHGLKTCTHGLKTCTHENVHPRKCAPTKGFERSSFRTDPSGTCSSHCGRPVYGSTFWRWHPADTVPES